MPYNYIKPSDVDWIREIDLLTYLDRCEPDELVRITDREYATKTHRSLRISNGKWHWKSKDIGGYSALDFLIKVRGMAFVEAAKTIQDRFNGPSSVPARIQPKPPSLDGGFCLPEPAPTNDNATTYLKCRGIDANIIVECIERGLVYETQNYGKSCVVFVGKDQKEQAGYAMLRECGGSWKGEAKGSKKRYSFKLEANEQNSVVHIFESAIDVLSYATLLKLTRQDWRAENLLSLGGIAVPSNPGKDARLPSPIEEYLDCNPDTKMFYLHLDNDSAGKDAAAGLSAMLSKQFCVYDSAPPDCNKDVNQYLQNQLRQQQRKHLERELVLQ
jgi:hypothetical protein